MASKNVTGVESGAVGGANSIARMLCLVGFLVVNVLLLSFFLV